MNKIFLLSAAALLSWHVSEAQNLHHSTTLPATSETQASANKETLLLRSPSISDEKICFTYASDIWISGKDGTHPRQLTTHPGLERHPHFSPDGKWIAFTGEYEGNPDVYIIPSEGGTPKRLTFHPGYDILRGWKNNNTIVFASTRQSNSGRYSRLSEIASTGGFPTVLSLPEAHQGSFSEDGRYIAYIKNPDPTESRGAYRPFKHYRGGNSPKIWIFDTLTNEIEEIPHFNSNNTHPVWVGNKVYFLSDRNGTTNIFSFSSNDQSVKQITHFSDFDVKTLNSNGIELTFEQAGRIHLLNLKTEKLSSPAISINTDIPNLRPSFKKGKEFIRNCDVSPKGMRAVMEVRGDLFTIPKKKGDIRNLTNTPGAHERNPVWSPNGKWIAYFSDESGEYQLKLKQPIGFKLPITIPLDKGAFYYDPVWSPDSKLIAFYNKHMELSYVNVETLKIIKIDTDNYAQPGPHFNASWSPDNQWITYTKRLTNQLNAVFIHHIPSGTNYQITDGMSEATWPTFSRNGKYLFFAASTNYALNASWLDMTNYERRILSSLYAIVLDATSPSPLAPESDEENISEEKKHPDKGNNNEPTPSTQPEKLKVRIDLPNIRDRIVALPVPARSYSQLNGNVEEKLFYLEQIPDKPGYKLSFYDLKEREHKTFLKRVNDYRVSADGENILYSAPNDSYGIVKSNAEASAGQGALALENLKVYVEPKQEWKQMFDELWRIERDFFYDENMHGANWKQIKSKYEQFLPHVAHREDLNYLFAEMMSELVIGHNYVGSGDYPEVQKEKTGLLGADYEIVNGKYRFKKIYSGLNWNPTFRAPLTEPGVEVKQGDYLLAINGNQLSPTMNIYSLFRNTVGKQTVLTINSSPTFAGAHKVTVIPISREAELRTINWVEENRKKVDELSDGKIAYVYMPNTGNGGYTFFNRYYFSQLDKRAVLIDERFNGGGSAADYVIDLLDRDLMNYWGARDGKITTTPGAAIFGPKAMIINEYAGSGGDLMPFLFKEKGLGKLIGKRTMGILVGIYGYPTLMDGGFVTAPRFGIFDKQGNWIIENEGVAPDIEVEQTPKEVIEGRDPQLEKAVEQLLEELKLYPEKEITKPIGPVRAKQL
jgi:tricorn protease